MFSKIYLYDRIGASLTKVIIQIFLVIYKQNWYSFEISLYISNLPFVFFFYSLTL